MTTFHTNTTGQMSTVDHPTPEQSIARVQSAAEQAVQSRQSLRAVLYGGGWFDDRPESINGAAQASQEAVEVGASRPLPVAAPPSADPEAST